ncbi:MAG: hypothetical protein IKD37_01210 [Clostridia bacterium]|nr:hypothetical protein [Clostridia bacterium]
MRRFRAILFVLFLIPMLCCTACQDTPVETPPSETTTQPAETTSVETPEETAPAEIPEEIVNHIIQDGKSEYVITMTEARFLTAANQLANYFQLQYGVSIPVERKAEDPAVYTYRIILEGATDQLKTRSDFAITVEKSTVRLAATDLKIYDYLLEYIYYDVFTAGEKTLTLTPENNMIYSESTLFETSYMKYWTSKNGACTIDFTNEVFEKYHHTGENGIRMAYSLYVPSNYTLDKQYPVLLYLHGAGHRGDDNARTLSDIVYCFFNHENVPVDEAIVLVPQCPSGMQWVDYPWSQQNYLLSNVKQSQAMTTLIEILDKVEAEYSTDKSRYYIYGISMGSYGTFDILARYADRFTAAIAISGGGPKDAADVLKNVPIWAVHSDDDTTVSVEGTREMVRLIREAGGTQMNYTEVTGRNHKMGVFTASNSELFEWLFSQKKQG